MKLEITSSVVIDAPLETVVEVVGDPARMRHAIPGATRVERGSDGVWTVIAGAGLAGARGAYRARVHPVAADGGAPGWTLAIAAAGEPGTIEARVEAALHAEGAHTVLRQTTTIEVSDRLAGVGAPVLRGAVTRFVEDLAAGLAVADVAAAAAAASADAGFAVAGGPDAERASSGPGGAASARPAVDRSGDTADRVSTEPRRSGPLLAAGVVGLATAAWLVIRRVLGRDAGPDT